VKDWQNNSLT